jgi:two-component system chemotaxis response regulator CheB
MIRVLVVDDSPTMRELIVSVLSRDPEVFVAGTAADGDEAVERALAIRPDIITMDIRMPRYDGVSAIRTIMRSMPTPIVVLCSDSGDSALNIGFNALKAGALEVVEKPHFASVDDVRRFGESFLATVKLMAEVRVVRLPYESGEFVPIAEAGSRTAQPRVGAVGVCASTGGPVALEYLFRHLPETYGAPIVVVQHITEGFLHGLVEWLNRTTPLEVKVAEEGEPVHAGIIYFAPEHRHLAIAPGGILVFRDDAPIRSHKPSGEILFSSLADCYGGRSIGVILTGMGEDGVDGLERLARCGGIVLAQDESTSAIFGMPRAAIDRQAATEVLPLERIAERLVYWTYGGPIGSGPLT